MTIIITICGIAVVALVIAGLAAKHQWDELGQALFGLVTEAQREYGEGTGQLKLAKVIEWAMPHIPTLLQAFISSDKLRKLIEASLSDAKELWAKNENLVKPLKATAKKV